MANPFLVLGGIAVGIITAAFGVLAVPGWVASAQDASAKNDIAQITIGQSASLSATGYIKSTVSAINGDDKVGVSVTTQATGTSVHVLPSAATNAKEYIVLVKSQSGKVFARANGGEIKVLAAPPADITTLTNYATTLTTVNGSAAG